jgi:DNA replication protein DnaD
MDKILTDWSEAGCKSTDECRRRFEESKAERAKNFVGSKKATREAKRRTPRYGDFDPNEAFKRALERSYGNSSGDMDCED